MARKLYEKQAVRRRNGQLADGVVLTVYTDAAGTVLADISTTVGGSAIAGSSVTTADIAGLGPASLRFWGPADGTDTLYMRTPADASLGVQKIEADPDPRLDLLEAGVTSGLAAHEADTTAIHGFTNTTALQATVAVIAEAPLNVEEARFQVSADDALCLQAAIDYAQTLVSGSTGAAEILLPPKPGGYSWATPIAWKSASIRAAVPNVGVKVKWNGDPGETVMIKDAALSGGTAFGSLSGINFDPGTAEPRVWVDLTDAAVDEQLRLENLQFGGGWECAIMLGSWWNAHWEHLRFDACGSGSGGFAIKMFPAASQSLGTFRLDGFTYDNNRAGSGAEGMILLDMTDNPGNIGTVALENGRIEANVAWTNRKGLIVAKLPASGVNSRSYGLAVRDVTYAASGGIPSGEVLLRQDTAATTTFPSLVVDNFRQDGLTTLVAGGLPAAYPAIPLQGNYGHLVVSQGNFDLYTDSMRAWAVTLHAVAAGPPAAGATIYLDPADSVVKIVKAGGTVIPLG